MGNSQCQDTIKPDSPAGTKKGLNIYTGSENKHRFSLAKIKNRLIFFFKCLRDVKPHTWEEESQFLRGQGSDFSHSIKCSQPLHGKYDARKKTQVFSQFLGELPQL